MTFEEEMLAALGTFVVEGRELLQEMEIALLALESEEDSTETINAIFRAAHTIKGSSGLFGLDHIVRFTHVVESVLDRLRSGEIAVTGTLVGVLLPCRDHIDELIDAVAGGELSETPKQAAASSALLELLAPFLVSAAGPSLESVESADTASAAAVRPVHVSLRFGVDSLRNGMDPLAFVRFLSSLGDLTSVTTVTDLLPEASAMDGESCYLGFEITLLSGAPLEEIEGAFDFVRDDSAIYVLEAGSPARAYAELVSSYGELGPQIAELLVRCGAVPADELAAALTGAGSAGSAGSASDDAPIRDQVPQQRDASAAEHPAADDAPPARAAVYAGPERRARDAGSIRVDAPRLDHLIDVVGELVIAGAGANLRASSSGDEVLVAALGELMRLVEEVRDSALQLRMVPIGTTFSRFQRVVRDMGTTLGKEVTLVITGGETEVDKALVERIGDPLMHLVRNSMDHGFGSARERAEHGKPPVGTLRLNAYHDSGSIVIEVADDGAGIDTARVLAKAVDRGLVPPGATPPDKEIFALIFEPGFSTAETVSDVSGRGVGMDVVKRNVTAMRGTIDVESTSGVGTTIRLRLPLTLAIIDGFLVGVAGATYVVPLDRVVECVELPSTASARECMDLRGEVLPFIRLRSLFGTQGDRPRRENVVVVECAGQKTGFVVDALMGEFQTVIKPLGELFSGVQGIGGSTILGNGDVALIIDVPTLVRHHTERETARHRGDEVSTFGN